MVRLLLTWMALKHQDAVRSSARVLIEDVEKIEERLRSESNPTGGGDCNGMSDGIDSDYSGPEAIDERDGRPRGYDVEFWEPLIDGDLGGSNAVEVVFNEKEANGVAKSSEGNRSEPAGGSSGGSGLKDEIPVDDFAWMGRTRCGCGVGLMMDDGVVVGGSKRRSYSGCRSGWGMLWLRLGMEVGYHWGVVRDVLV
ncbi:hypothetical protein DY000_02063682 [Brassica cretica]|uniref:Uncharacterized protein n=1 Tax=Brassica cretica TaxID=69181 RepID=A0ABQ7ANB3_BRACR|nr:hypothetical protein DY000_02063682 [Brassica cretica]